METAKATFLSRGIIPWIVTGGLASTVCYRETNSVLKSIIAFIFGWIYFFYFAIRYGIVQPERLRRIRGNE